MKVKEFIELLKMVNQEHEVILAKDSEGNDFSPFSDHCICMYEATSTWSGEILTEVDAMENDRHDYIENAIVLWPVN